VRFCKNRAVTHMTSHQVKPLQVRFVLADFAPLRAGRCV